jgi:zinc transport system substrate-binding protein
MLKQIFWWCLLCMGVNLAHAGTLVASTHPLYLIAQAVTQGVERPVLLIPPQQDGHHLQLTPNDRRILKQSDFVLWVGPEYEAALNSTLRQQANAVALTTQPTFHRLSLRDVQGQPIDRSLDPHLWLDPNHAITIAQLIANIRSIQFPQHRQQYQKNAQQFRQRMVNAVQSLPNRPAHYWAYHDAYQYLEKTLHLQFSGSLTADPELPPTATQLKWLKQQPRTGARCVLTEHPLPSATLRPLQPIQVRVIDETLSQSTDFIDGWRSITTEIQQCIQNK